MPRSKNFDEDAVLTATMHAFRKDGYAGVSIKSLERATGLSSGSLYHSFGGKEALFVKALGHYNRTVVQRRVSEHLQAKRPVDGLRSLFLSLLHEPDDSTNGCLLTNCAVEFGTGESVAKSGVREGLHLLEDAFRAVIDRMAAWRGTAASWPKAAQAREQIPLKLLALYQGILVLIRFGRSKQELADLINSEIDLLFGGVDD